jgi:hypothetical protein
MCTPPNPTHAAPKLTRDADNPLRGTGIDRVAGGPITQPNALAPHVEDELHVVDQLNAAGVMTAVCDMPPDQMSASFLGESSFDATRERVDTLPFAVESLTTHDCEQIYETQTRHRPPVLTASAVGRSRSSRTAAKSDLTHNTPVSDEEGHPRCFPRPSTPAAGGHSDRPDADSSYSFS